MMDSYTRGKKQERKDKFIPATAHIVICKKRKIGHSGIFWKRKVSAFFDRDMVSNIIRWKKVVDLDKILEFFMELKSQEM